MSDGVISVKASGTAEVRTASGELANNQEQTDQKDDDNGK